MLDSAAPKTDIAKFMANETRFRVVEQQNPARYKTLLAAAQKEVASRFALYEQMAKMTMGNGKPAGQAE